MRAADRQARAAWLALLIAAVAATALTSQLRPLDGDEGYYAAAAAEVTAGRLPYRDFFYPQAPLLPFVYAPVVSAAGPALRSLRWLSVLLGCGTILLWWRWLTARYGSGSGVAWAALVLLAANPHVLSWVVTVKTYALTGLGSTLGLLALWRGMTAGGRPAWLAAAGLALGLTGSARLLLSPLGPACAAALVLWPGAAGRRAAWRQAAWLGAGWIAGMVPVLAAWLVHGEVFLFDALRYHTIRFSELRALHPDAGLGVRVLAALRGTAGALAASPFLLLVMAAAGFGLGRRGPADDPHRRHVLVSAAAGGALLLAGMTPDPVHAQYFTAPLVPLLLPAAAAGLERLTGGRPARAWPAGGAILAAAVLVMVLLRPGLPRDPVWSFASYDAVTAAVAKHSRPGDIVFSFWPGYVFESGRRHLPGMENHFALGVSEALTPAQKARCRIADRDRLEMAFRGRVPQLVVTGTWMNEVHTALDQAQLLQLVRSFRERYGLVAQVGDVRIYSRDAPVVPGQR